MRKLDALSMTGAVVPFLLTYSPHAMHRAGGRPAGGNTQYDDSALDYLRFHDSGMQGHMLMMILHYLED
jgi:hypothetical protein